MPHTDTLAALASDSDAELARLTGEVRRTPGDAPFAWIADMDSRIGPMCEAFVDGKYVWIPFDHLAKVTIDPPADLRDLIWAGAELTFANGGTTVAMIPSRYPGSEAATDG